VTIISANYKEKRQRESMTRDTQQSSRWRRTQTGSSHRSIRCNNSVRISLLTSTVVCTVIAIDVVMKTVTVGCSMILVLFLLVKREEMTEGSGPLCPVSRERATSPMNYYILTAHAQIRSRNHQIPVHHSACTLLWR
jgi:hypothetical protein